MTLILQERKLNFDLKRHLKPVLGFITILNPIFLSNSQDKIERLSYT